MAEDQARRRGFQALSEHLPKLAVALLIALLGLDIALRLRPVEVHGQEALSRAARREKRRDATVRAVEKAGLAVANISTEQVVRRRRWGGLDAFDDFFEGFLDGRGRVQKTRSLGSGIIIDSDGYIVTNAHVVSQASRIVVTLPDDSSFEAQLIKASEEHDLALLKVQAGKPLPTIPLGSSKELWIGEAVIALGNPFGLENSVTRGVVSARDRRIVRDGKTLPGTFLQTDAAINPGNSGGPLINIDAELVGINTAVHASGQGIGFAIPVDRVREVLNELSDPERLSSVWSGFRLLDEDPVRVSAVSPGSPADKANISVGDLVRQVEGVAVRTVFDVQKLLLNRIERGERSVTMDVERGGRLYRTRVSLVERPSVGVIQKKLGLKVGVLSSRVAIKAGLIQNKGVLVEQVEAGGPAARIGVRAGDIIVRVAELISDARGNRARRLKEIVEMDELARFLEERAAGEAIALVIVREGQELVGELGLR